MASRDAARARLEPLVGAPAGGGTRMAERAPGIVLLLPALVTLALSIIFWHGLQATDDLRYARMAISLLPGEHAAALLLQPHHHAARLVPVYALAGVFPVLGVSEWSLSLLPAVCSALTASLVAWLAFRFGGRSAGLTAGLLYAAFPLTISLATFFVPEPLLGFELCLAAVLFVRAVESNGGASPRVLPVTERLLAPACLPLLVLAGIMIADARSRIVCSHLHRRKMMGRALFGICAVVLAASSFFAMWLHGRCAGVLPRLQAERHRLRLRRCFNIAGAASGWRKRAGVRRAERARRS